MSLLSTYRIPQPRGYSERNYYIEDTSETSPEYFNVEFFPMVVGGGRHIIKLKGNGLNLRQNKSIDVEIIDAEGQRIFCEVVDYFDRFNNYYISIDIYDITAQGVATAYFVGEALLDLNGNPIPSQYRDEYNVRWVKQFNVLPFERNNADLIFDEPPIVSVAQTITPAIQLVNTTSSAYNYVYITSSVNLLNIITSNFQGYDRDFASSADILDPVLKGIMVNPLGKPMTMNSVPTTIRRVDADMQNGSVVSNTSRFNTILKASQSFFKKEMVGAYFEFYDSSSIPQTLAPSLPAGVTVSGSLNDQFDRYNATIVEVVSSTQAILSKPLQIITLDSNGAQSDRQSTYTYKQASLFTGSITYIPTDISYVTSSTVSQSYVEFTFYDMNPISGQVYRIKTSTKLGSVTGDYKVLNDQVIRPVEYLTDAQYPNAINYSRHVSDYRLIGYFTTQSIFDDYWSYLEEGPLGFDPINSYISSSIQAESVRLLARHTQSAITTTQYNQNYNNNQTYTLSFYLTLDPYTELEIYMNSEPLNTYITIPQLYPKAFQKSKNTEKQRYSGELNRFGKYIGKITNDSPGRKYYSNVSFDFTTDSDGLGRPALRARIVDEINITGSAYVSEISIRPWTINGFTPNIIQYAVPLSTELITAATLTQSVDFKIDYFDYTGKQSEYVTFLDDVILNLRATVNTNQCQDDKVYFYYNSAYPLSPSLTKLPQ
jgi:hypothetical protein